MREGPATNSESQNPECDCLQMKSVPVSSIELVETVGIRSFRVGSNHSDKLLGIQTPTNATAVPYQIKRSQTRVELLSPQYTTTSSIVVTSLTDDGVAETPTTDGSSVGSTATHVH